MASITLTTSESLGKMILISGMGYSCVSTIGSFIENITEKESFIKMRSNKLVMNLNIIGKMIQSSVPCSLLANYLIKNNSIYSSIASFGLSLFNVGLYVAKKNVNANKHPYIFKSIDIAEKTISSLIKIANIAIPIFFVYVFLISSSYTATTVSLGVFNLTLVYFNLYFLYKKIVRSGPKIEPDAI